MICDAPSYCTKNVAEWVSTCSRSSIKLFWKMYSKRKQNFGLPFFSFKGGQGSLQDTITMAPGAPWLYKTTRTLILDKKVILSIRKLLLMFNWNIFCWNFNSYFLSHVSHRQLFSLQEFLLAGRLLSTPCHYTLTLQWHLKLPMTKFSLQNNLQISGFQPTPT